MLTASSESEMAARLSSLTWMVQPSGGGSPATAMSPPRLTSTPPPSRTLAAAAAARSDASALAVAPRSSSTPRGITTVRAAELNRIALQPGILFATSRIDAPSGGTDAKSAS